MATKQLIDNFVNTIIDTAEAAFTAPVDKDVVVDVFTVANNSTVNASYKAYIKSVSGTLTPIIPTQFVVWGEQDLGVGLAGQVVPAGGTLQVESSALTSLYFTASGREI